MPQTFTIQATWDDEAELWVADSDDIPGIAAEAKDREELLAKLAILIPEMMELNNVPADRAKPLEIIIRYHREDRIQLPLAA